jgi:methylmalonyl-CoA mutase
MDSTAKNETNTNEELALDEFPPHTYDAWREAADKLLKGANFEKLLISKTYEGFNLNPLYRREDISELAHMESHPGLSAHLLDGSK